MTKFPPCSVVVTYDEDRQWLIVQSVSRARVAQVLAGELEVPVLLDEFDFRIDDEFARRLGVAMLNAIALGQPEIKQYMTVTPDPIDRSSDE
ncbi:hypothetical protein PQR70_09270 [Paraburkholderia madseniana]|uniref:Uncharacterized protein n=1 Tax=Paraburkholderia madseniana TaxID=2599607 RepID=A0AAP5BCR1_9BURK|nr:MULTISPECIES: hypothetical protein [Paraburkholderia]MCX4145694.1 hypothetical protein [Paraburkholderia madseniana]MDN7148642.1 hypothetical protein [Paraburkholderia sp. WS6]MDQ6407522.1 hypothetical protein [Paraburkholderia madseniana]